MLDGEPTTEEYIRMYQSLNFSHLVDFKKGFMKKVRFEFLICGHLTSCEAQQISKTIIDSFEHENLKPEDKFIKHPMI